MIQIKKEGIILEKTELYFENEGVLNPAAIKEGRMVHLFYRSVSSGNHSTIGYCRLDGPLEVVARRPKPLLVPEFDYESHGLEDPRIVKIEDTYFLTYTGYDGINALGCLTLSKDLVHFEKKGVISPQITYTEFDRLARTNNPLNDKYFRYNQQNGILEKEGEEMLLWIKNLIFFPEKINGKLFFIHQIRPDIQITSFSDLEDLTPQFWQDYFLNFNDHILIAPKYEHEMSYVGGGCAPIKTNHGWLFIYHGVKDSLEGYIYSACVPLFDLENPQKEIARLPYPLLVPEMDWEIKGEVHNVCFPSGAVIFDDTLYIYYGAADERIACVSVSFSGLISELMQYKTKNDNKNSIPSKQFPS